MFDKAIEKHLRRHEARFALAPLFPLRAANLSLYFPCRGVIASIRKATNIDGCCPTYPPKRKHIRNVILYTYSDFWGPPMVKELTSIQLPFEPPPMQSLGDSADPMGNSIHNRSSQARMSSDYHGLRAFKALILVHSILREGPVELVHDISPLRYWMNGLARDVEWCSDGARGYGTAVAMYVRYLSGKVKLHAQFGADYNLSPPSLISFQKSINHLAEKLAWLQTMQDSSLELRQLLLSEIQGNEYVGSRGVALTLLLRDCVNVEKAQSTIYKRLQLSGLEEQERDMVPYKMRFETQMSELTSFLAQCSGKICITDILMDSERGAELVEYEK